MNYNQQNEILLPSVDGSYTIPEALDFHRKHNPQEPIYVFSADESSQEPTTITFGEFGRACDRVAQYVRPGRSIHSDGQVVAMIVVTDTLLYQALLMGVMKAGLVPFPISHRLTPQAVVNLLKVTSCHDLITTSATLPSDLLGGIKEELKQNHDNYELRIDEMPSLDYMYPKLGNEIASDPFDPYPLPSEPPSRDDIVIYLHSSGSTGLPKHVPQTHRIFSQWAAFGLPGIRSHNNPRLRYGAMALPPFHAWGFHIHTVLAVYHALSIGVYPPTSPNSGNLSIVPSPENVLEHTKRTKCSGLATVPAFLHSWAHSESYVNYLATLDHIVFAGGAVSTKVGDALVAAGANLQSIYGATEFGPACKFYTRPGRQQDWEWIEFSEQTKVEWIDQGDGTYECHFLICEGHTPAFANRNDKKGYATSDLLINHPTNNKLWKIVGRLDDVIIHSSGEKTVPTPMEEIILSSPMVKGAIVFGRGHDNAGVLIEPRSDLAIDVKNSTALADLRNLMWPIVEEANKVAPNYSRIFKEMILITARDKPLPRSAKGTVMRKLALRVYDEDIEELYKIIATSSGSDDVKPPRDWEPGTVEQWLLEQVSRIHSGEVISPTKDVFEQGLDSLSATFLRRRVLSAIRSSKPSAGKSISPNILYTYPTIEKLAQYLSGLVANPAQIQSSDGHVKSIEAMIEEYSVGLAPVVLLTGSTGHLGSQILANLLQDDTVKRVYAFNRPSRTTIEDRHIDRFKHGGLDIDLLQSEKLRFVEAELSKKDLGVSGELYKEMQKSVTIIIHTSWRLDFNLTLVSFESHIRGVRNLIDLARRGPHASTLRFIFTSSIASTQSWDKTQGVYPEEVVRQSKYAVGNGYGESKYVAERILERSGLRACSLRIGQLSGSSTKGAWAPTEWFPNLVKSSIALGGFPSAPGMASWLPMDSAAQSILDLAYTKEKLPFAINFTHPRPVTWDYVIEAVRDAVVDALRIDPVQLPLIPFPEWIDRLANKAMDAKPEDLERMPAIKIIDFFQEMAKADQIYRSTGQTDVEFTGLATLETKNAPELSITMRTVTPLQVDNARSWVAYWREAGFL
ncbi:putative aminoadipate reductase [Macrolepiota fuliginosa MF-IS2]|uniref:Aminoadipate reductase n=1 Tax=Macrolepiota fuliginosa MF-IS2 TaxID=1400762 RepID=A0A9P5XAW7_9AGAR|nr:putative aminoadipate reductase [Macrolepiota fuliginosa MF-IS2]